MWIFYTKLQQFKDLNRPKWFFWEKYFTGVLGVKKIPNWVLKAFWFFAWSNKCSNIGNWEKLFLQNSCFGIIAAKSPKMRSKGGFQVLWQIKAWYASIFSYEVKVAYRLEIAWNDCFFIILEVTRGLVLRFSRRNDLI